VAINQQIIEIVTKFTDGASKKIREVHQRMEELGGGMQRVTNTTRTLNKETNRCVMEIMSTALGILFLPLAEELLNWAIAFLDWVQELSPAQKKWIGIITLTVVALGGLLMVVGQVALGLAGIAWLVGAKNIAIFREAILSTTGKVGLLKTALGKIVFVAVGITIAWAGFKFIKTGIEEGSILKELGGIVGVGLGVGAIGLSIGGPWGAGIGFVIGVTAAIIMDFVMGGSVGKSIAKKVAKIGGIFSLPLAGTLPGFQEILRHCLLKLRSFSCYG